MVLAAQLAAASWKPSICSKFHLRLRDESGSTVASDLASSLASLPSISQPAWATWTPLAMACRKCGSRRRQGCASLPRPGRACASLP
eukprot:6183729-Prymnesium_polylepis.1